MSLVSFILMFVALSGIVAKGVLTVSAIIQGVRKARTSIHRGMDS